MNALPTDLFDAAGLRADFLANLALGTVVLEMFSGPPALGGSKSGVGMIVSGEHDKLLLPFTPWSSLTVQAGQLTALSSEIGIVIPDITLRAEIDIKAAAPRVISSPTGQHPPTLTIKDGEPLILAVENPQQASQRMWAAFDLQGLRRPYYSSGSTSIPLFDEWVLVLTRNGNRSEQRIK